MAAAKRMTVKIRGDVWKVLVLSPEDFQHNFSDNYLGVTSAKKDRFICFRADDISLNVVIHELFHAHFGYLCLESVPDFSINQVEEIVAEWMGDHGIELIEQAKKLYNRLVRKGDVKTKQKT